MYHGCKTMSKEIGDDDVIDDIIKSKSMSTFWTAVTLLIFKLERRTNAQMWRIGLAIWMLYWFQNLLNHYSCRHYVTSYHHFRNFGKYAISECHFIIVIVVVVVVVVIIIIVISIVIIIYKMYVDVCVCVWFRVTISCNIILALSGRNTMAANTTKFSNAFL